MQLRAYRRDRPGLDHRALAVIALCAALPVLIGILLTARHDPAQPPPDRPAAGHWVYVPSEGAAVHVDGAAKRVDASVRVGSASTGSQVIEDRHTAFLVDEDRVVLFGRDGVTGDAPAAGVAEAPVPVTAGGSAYLVYRTAGLIVRLGTRPVTVSAGGTLGAPVVTPDGRLWTYIVDSGRLCELAGGTTLHCPVRVSAGHVGALSVLAGRPGFVDVTDGTWQEISERGSGEPVSLGVSLPENAMVGAAGTGGRLPIVDPAAHRLLLVPPRGEVITVPLDAGRYGPPVSTGDAVAVLDTDRGAITSYDASGQRRARLSVPGAVRLTMGTDGRGYADAADGSQSAVLDPDGTLTAVRTSDVTPSYRPAAPTPTTSLPAATVGPTTTETIPPLPKTVTVEVTPTSSGAESPPPADTPTGGTSRPNEPGTTTSKPPGPPPGSPTVDVLSATAIGQGQARIRIRVHGAGPVFCHVFFNSVERAATRCGGTMTVVAKGLAAGSTYDVYVIGTNAKGTGNPGRRAVLRT